MATKRTKQSRLGGGAFGKSNHMAIKRAIFLATHGNFHTARDAIKASYPDQIERYDLMIARDILGKAGKLDLCVNCKCQFADFKPDQESTINFSKKLPSCKPCAGWAGDSLYRASRFNEGESRVELTTAQIENVQSSKLSGLLTSGIACGPRGIYRRAIKEPGRKFITEKIESGCWIYTEWAKFDETTRILSYRSSHQVLASSIG